MKKAQTANSTVRQFYKLAEAYLEETFARFPVSASLAGRHEFDPYLGHATERTHQEQARLVQQTLADIENLPDGDFDANNWLDRRMLLANLRTEKMSLTDLKHYRRNPQTFAHTAVDSIHYLVVRNADNLR